MRVIVNNWRSKREMDLADALFEAGRGLECRYCGRHYRAGDLFEGDPCPSDGCPSHELKELQ